LQSRREFSLEFIFCWFHEVILRSIILFFVNYIIIKFIYLGVTYVYQLTKVTVNEISNTTSTTVQQIISLNNTPILNIGLFDPEIVIPTFEYTFKRTLDLFDINTLTHKNTR